MEIKNSNGSEDRQRKLAPSGCGLPMIGEAPEKPPC